MLPFGRRGGLQWFWYFMIYSFLGFLAEVIFAHARHGRTDRKCLLVLPLCPVYGLGACAVLGIAPLVYSRPALLFLAGAAVCTVVEYGMAVWYECVIGVPFWDYTGVTGNLHGRVCLPFSLAWGALILVTVYLVHPAVAALAARIPAAAYLVTAPLLLTDFAASSVLLRRTGDRRSLQWYAALSHRLRAQG